MGIMLFYSPHSSVVKLKHDTETGFCKLKTQLLPMIIVVIEEGIVAQVNG